MLYSLDSNKTINTIPYKGEYDVWRNRLSKAEYELIIQELTNKIRGSDIQTSSWMPGKDWTNTVFAPIYSKACKSDYTQAAKFFGLLVWETFLRHPDYWAFGRYELDGIPIQGLTYFRVTPR
ncbi:hypothetical protein [Dawidia soli]|uniref:Uncharacterized protein n=1 Tax=Dawidia soli TaxID=2782352 RepID=A0AAP2DC29_9BACT|nr:hypothetical protein [Dawidia soli]MBT1689296.1 hypothetical protein [Dawidia soli]